MEEEVLSSSAQMLESDSPIVSVPEELAVEVKMLAAHSFNVLLLDRERRDCLADLKREFLELLESSSELLRVSLAVIMRLLLESEEKVISSMDTSSVSSAGRELTEEH